MALEELLNVTDVARLAKLSTATIRKHVLMRDIPYLKVFAAVRFRPSEIEAWIIAREAAKGKGKGEGEVSKGGNGQGGELFQGTGGCPAVGGAGQGGGNGQG